MNKMINKKSIRFERIHSWSKGLQNVEGSKDHEEQIHGIIVENRQGGGLRVRNIVLLPQNPAK